MTTIIIQARLGSERLSQKILKEVAPDVNLLQMVIRRCKKSKLAEKIIVALAHDSKEVIPIVEAEGVEWSWYPYEGRNVLEEYYMAALKFGAHTVVRITSDCPCIDPRTIDQMIMIFRDSGVDLVYNHNDNLASAGVEIDGVDIEIFSFNALYHAYHGAVEDYDKEHCCPWMYKNLKIHRVEQGWTGEILPEWINDEDKQVKLSVNTQEQLDRVKKIVGALGTDFDTRTLVEYLSKNRP